MSAPSPHARPVDTATAATDPLALVRAAVHHAAHLLPSQNPLQLFVHHNTLHAFEHLPFRQGVEAAADLHGARAWCRLPWYRQAYAEGRILQRDLDEVLRIELVDEALELPGRTLPRREAVKLLMLAPETGLHEREASAWALHEMAHLEQIPAGLDRSSDERLRLAGDAPKVLRALWQACSAVASEPPEPTPRTRLAAEVARHLGDDLDAVVEPHLIRWAAAYLDLGQAYWPMPHRELGFFGAMLHHLDGLGTHFLPGGRWLRAEIRRLRAQGVSAAASAQASLAEIGVADADIEAFVTETLLALPGFGGMFVRLHERPDFAPVAPPPTDVMDLLAIRLLCERAATRSMLRRHGVDLAAGGTVRSALRAFRLAQPKVADSHAEIRRVAPLVHVALTLGLRPDDIAAATPPQLAALRSLVAEGHERQLRWLWQLAYERRYRVEVLDALVLHNAATTAAAAAAPAATRPPHTQVITCIDDREESLRRHLEELDAGYVTYGSAGFFGLPIRFYALGEPTGRVHCPAAMRPTHALIERPGAATGPARVVGRSALSGGTSELLETGASLGLVRGLLAGLTGWLALLPMAWRLLFPEASATGNRRQPRPSAAPPTQLTLHHDPLQPPVDGLPVGFTTDQLVAICLRVLGEVALTQDFAPLLVVLGHGSASVNNPHEAGYNCGACSGGSGAPNARAFAQALNTPAVRAGLRAKGVDLPATTHVIGGHHNTANDAIELFDLDAVPASHVPLLARLRADLDAAATRDAHERVRRFESVDLGISERDALRHVMGRVDDLAQARPEYNHVTNALCVVGRRALTRGLFLDRRAFLVSYDPAADPDAAILGQILASVGPVGAGINLEYFFSYVDNERYGAGTKLPHNVVGLLAVMNGSSSDLRTGLVEQMIEIHEPMRLLVVVEGTPEAAAKALGLHADLRRLVAHRWILVATYDPASGEAHVLEERGFVRHEVEASRLPSVASSKDWYGGQRGCLRPARIDGQHGAATPTGAPTSRAA